MRGVINFFHDNAMFYKDITQWLRNRTFGSLFFGLLLVAEALSLFIIAGSEDINQPGVSMFYTLFLVLIVYALIIAFLGNSLTSREFVNRTFELYELSGMSLERMIGGKMLSMLYQFFFGFFCLVPFMFFAYFLGGLDFLEMLVGVLFIVILSLPLYLTSLLMALAGRFKQISILTKLASIFLMGAFALFALIAFFSGNHPMQELVQELTDVFKSIFNGDWAALAFVIAAIATYVQVCLLLFYFCCNSISRETDSREIPIKVLSLTLMISWLVLHAASIVTVGYTKGDANQIVTPIFLMLLSLALLTYYNRVSVPPIVARRYRDVKGFKKFIYWLFQPGINGGLRTLLLLIAVAVVAGTLVMMLPGFTSPLVPVSPTPGSAPSATSTSITMGSSTYLPGMAFDEWLIAVSLLVQIPWFLALPHLFFVRAKNIRHNVVAQRSVTVASWVILGSLVLIFGVWTSSNLFGGGYGGNAVSFGDVVMVTVLSPLPSMAMLGSAEPLVQALGMSIRFFTGIVGTILILRYVAHVTREHHLMVMDSEDLPAVTTMSVSKPEDEIEEQTEEKPTADMGPNGREVID